jgi:hypothetical protein
MARSPLRKIAASLISVISRMPWCSAADGLHQTARFLGDIEVVEDLTPPVTYCRSFPQTEYAGFAAQLGAVICPVCFPEVG